MLHKPLHSHNTRHAQHSFFLPNVQNKRGKKAFCYWGPHTWNALSTDAQLCLTTSTFTKAILPVISAIADM